MKPGYSMVDVEKVRRKSASGKSVECLIEGDWAWVPRSVMRDPDSVGLGATDTQIVMATWYAEKQGWAADEIAD